MEVEAQQLAPLVQRIHERLVPGRPLRAPRVTFYPYVSTKSTVRERGGRLHLRLSDHLQGAPEAVIEGVVAILLSRIHRVKLDPGDPAVAAYKRHVNSQSADRRRQASRKARGRKFLDPVGEHRSLLESYLRVCLEMDLAVPQAPTLSWSQTRSRRRFGHWDADHGCIVISRVLDDDRVPEFVLDYVVYHEILHIILPPERGGGQTGRRRVHPPEFKAAERRFARWKEAEGWLARLASARTPAAKPNRRIRR